MNHIITKKENKSKSFELSFLMRNSNGIEFLDYDLPHPNYHFKTAQGHLLISWLICGFTGTKASVDYLNDIIARYILSFPENKVERTKIWKKREDSLTHNSINKLKEFQNLKSIKSKARAISQRANLTATRDQIFYALKFYAEQLIRDFYSFTYSDLLDFALNNFEDYEKSTLRAKCKSIFNWYYERSFEIGRANKKYSSLEEYHKETKMTRTEHITKVNKAKGEEKKRAIINLTTGLFAEDYKKKNGTWNKRLIADTLNINKKTVYKYL